MPTVKEMAECIGKEGSIYNGTLRIKVRVVDVKQSYGKQRWEVEPVAGSGRAWVESVEFTD